MNSREQALDTAMRIEGELFDRCGLAGAWDSIDDEDKEGFGTLWRPSSSAPSTRRRLRSGRRALTWPIARCRNARCRNARCRKPCGHSTCDKARAIYKAIRSRGEVMP